MSVATRQKSPTPGSSTSLPPTRGKFVCDWIERFCRLGTGDYYGQSYRLRRWQKAFIWDLYELAPNGMDRRYRSALLGLPRGNGKSALIAAIGVYELCSGHRESPLVSVCAASFEQSNHVFGDMKTICLSSPELAPTVNVFDTEILLKDRPGRAYRVAAVAGTNEGQRPTAAIFDEVHELTGNKERVHLVLTNGLAKRRNAFALNISTAGYDPESLLGRMYEHGRKVEKGEIQDPGFLFRWYEGHAGIDPKSREEWTAEVEFCNPAAGDFLDTASVVSRCMEIPRHEADRYHRNIWTESSETWEAAELWDGLRDPSIELSVDEPLYVGLDVGVTHDSSAVVWTQRVDGRLPVRAKVWENPHPRGSRLHNAYRFEIKNVEDLCRELRDLYPVSAARDDRGRALPGPAFYYDPNKFERSAQDLKAEGLTMVEYSQHDSRMVTVGMAFFELIKKGVIVHDGNPDLRRQIRNVVAEQKPRGWKMAKITPGSPKHIDAAVACGLAVYEASRAEPAPAPPQVFSFSAKDLGLGKEFEAEEPADEPD